MTPGLATIDPTIGVIVVALIAPLGAFLLAAKRFSGKINSSEAKELWDASRSIREWSAQQISRQEQKIAVLESRIDSIEKESAALGRENMHLVQQVRDLSDTITELRAEIVALTGELRKSHDRVRELEDEAS